MNKIDTLPIIAALLISTSAALAQNFNGAVPAYPGVENDDSPGSRAAKSASQRLPNSAGGPSDYSDDEKRMRKKYKAKLAHAKDTIAKGEDMIKDGKKKNDDRLIRRGKVFKEIGEKDVAELNANNPLIDEKDKDKDKDKGDKSSKDKGDKDSK